MQDTEFTIEEGRLYLLQTRSAKRPAQAAVRFAVDAVEEGLLDKERGDRDDRRRVARRAAAPHDRPRRRVRRAGDAASAPRPARRRGEVVFTADEAVDAAADGQDVILVRPFTEADDVAGFHAARGILTSEGGKASHAALVARGMGRPCVCGASELEISLGEREVRVGDTTIGAGDRITIDGGKGDGDARGRAARGSRDERRVPDGARMGRRGPTARRARERRRPGGRRAGARARRGGDRPVPDRAHVRGARAPAADAGHDRRRGRRRPARGARPSCGPSSRATSRASSRR